MAVMTLSNHVLTAIATGATYPDWVCIERIIWTNIWLGIDQLAISDSNGKTVLATVRGGGAGLNVKDREIEMDGKWANGLVLSMSKFGIVNIYLRQEPKDGCNDSI